jgi:hypothetical protein
LASISSSSSAWGSIGILGTSGRLRGGGDPGPGYDSSLPFRDIGVSIRHLPPSPFSPFLFE